MSVIKNRLQRTGIKIVEGMYALPDVDPAAADTIRRVEPYTMTSPERVFGLIQALRYVVSAGIPGAVVECGVWRGGSMMASALTLIDRGNADRELFLFDTYEGMSSPTEADRDWRGGGAIKTFERTRRGADSSSWCYASLEDVRANLGRTEYDPRLVHFVKGKVEDTIPDQAPDQIAVLRLDTDWYESTRHELTHLYPRLSRGGVLIIDDYGHWEGARRATDEFLSSSGTHLLLNRLDYTGRIAVKP